MEELDQSPIFSSPLSSLNSSNDNNNSIIQIKPGSLLLETEEEDLLEEEELIPDSEEEEEEEEEQENEEVLAELLLLSNSNSNRSKRVKLNPTTTTTTSSIPSPPSHTTPYSLPSPSLKQALQALPQPPLISSPIQQQVTLPPPPSPLLSQAKELASQSASQVMSWFLNNVDPEELDMLPSSDPEELVIQEETAEENPVDFEMSKILKEVEIKNGLKRKLEMTGIEIDDSGHFDTADLELVEEEVEEVKEPSPLEVDGLEMEFEGDAMWAGLDDAAFDLLVTGGGGIINEESTSSAIEEDEHYDVFNEEEKIPDGFVVGFGRAGGNSLRGSTITNDFMAPTFTSAPYSSPYLATDFTLQSSPSTNLNSSLSFAGFQTVAASTSNATNFQGFTSGRGTTVPLSEAALERARKLVLGSSPPLALPPPSSSPAIRPTIAPLPPLGRALLSLRQISKSNSKEEESVPSSFTSATINLPSINPPRQELGGFTSGNGKALVEPSAESIKRSEGLWEDLVVAGEGSAQIVRTRDEGKEQDVFLNSPRNSSSSMMKTLGSDLYKLPVSNLVLENVSNFESPAGLLRTRSISLADGADTSLDITKNLSPSSSPSSITVVNNTVAEISEYQSPVLSTLKTLPSPSIQSTPLPFRNPLLQQSLRSTNPIALQYQNQSTRTSTPLASTSKLPNPFSTLSKSTTATSTSNYHSFRPPLLSNSTNTPSSYSNVSEVTTPAISRKLNIGMTPRTRNNNQNGLGNTGTKKFVTPFKDGVRPIGLASGVVSLPRSNKVGLGSVGRGVIGGGIEKGKAKEIKLEKEDSNFKKLFDLSPVESRQSLFDSGMRPQTHYYEDLLASGLSQELLEMDSVSAVAYVFPCGRGEIEAFETIKEEGGTYVTQVWISNHWSLVVWKLAGLVRTQPSLVETYWNWEVALNQLKYRYEREINNAQRSCIKKIQEQDSPSTLPMILVVSQIRWDDPPNSENLNLGEEALLIIVGLELTDGWYRIRANIDITLKNACERGKIVVGTKLAISGARIESSRDGTEVLDALTRSSINITGNSTSLAPWHSKLGFVQQPFIATLNSLSSAGGVAPLVDLIVERIFPSGFIDMNKKTDSETWCEEEERVRKEQWERGHAKAQAKLVDAEDKTAGEWDSIIEALQEATQSRGPTTDSTLVNEEADELLESIECAKDQESIIRRLTRTQVLACLALAQENAIQAKYQVMSDLQEELATSFPPRDVREFKVIRVRDFNGGKCTRTALLTVWEVKTVANNFLKPGQRYLVSNVMPKGSWTSKTLEITLVTRRDSRWQLVEGGEKKV